MGICDAPQWILSTWVRSCQEAGATASQDVIGDTGERLLARWASADRYFHNIRHLAEVLCHFDEIAHEAQNPAVVRLAIFYHGAVFHSELQRKLAGSAGEDEQSGGLVAAQELPPLGIPDGVVQRVVSLLSALPGHCPGAGDVDAAALSDADLATLAAEPQRYKHYVMGIRAEYADIPVRLFAEARLRVLEKLLARPHIYRTAAAHAWEEPARQNLVAESHRIAKELTRLTLQEDIDDAALQAAFTAEAGRTGGAAPTDSAAGAAGVSPAAKEPASKV